MEGPRAEGDLEGAREKLGLARCAQRHQVVSDTLALLLFIGLDLPLGSRAAALIGDKVL